MRSKIVKYIFKKEMTDILRDKKTLFMMIILPIILYPVLMILATQAMTTSLNNMNQKEINIAFSSKPNQNLQQVFDESILNSKKNEGKLNIVKVDNYKKALEENKIDAYINIEEATKYKVYSNSSKENYNLVNNRVEEILKKYKENLVEEKIKSAGLNIQNTLKPMSYQTIDTAKNEEIAGNLLGQILPCILIIGVLLGAIYPAIDVMAGEKERGTLETLFTLPITNLELVMGKYMAVSLSAIVTAVLNMLSIFLTMVFLITTSGLAGELGMEGFSINELIFPGIITMICICLFAMVVSAISMCVCSLAKSFKDAQNYITPLMLIVMIPGYASMIPSVVLDKFTATIPVVNISLLIKSVLSFKSDLGLISLVLVSNLAFVILSVYLLSKMFNSEEILFGNSKSFSFLEKRANIKVGTMPSVSDGVVLYAIGLVLLIYVGTIIQMKYEMTGIAITQVMIIALPLLFAAYIKTNFKETFSLKVPKLKHLLGGAILWMGGYIIVIIISQLILYLFPQNMEVVEALNDTLFIKENFLLNLFVIACMPAICEEMFFRGFVFTSFKVNKGKKSAKGAILFSAILFGFMHIDFIRIIPVSILGVILAYSVYKSGSIFVAMLIHFLNNGFAVLISHYPNSQLSQIYKFIELDFNNLDLLNLIVLIMVAVVLVGIGVLLFSTKKNKIDNLENNA
ncbi:ABC transporter permease subunit/CPBP intramembrane protease [Romboutsia sp.]|uniref:ABC transporter permease subunit/CPBP intramembrane protease n=1 Tax=Romboutsia sp. TaxID=1965302 RepID=UPI003F370B73